MHFQIVSREYGNAIKIDIMGSGFEFLETKMKRKDNRQIRLLFVFL